MLLVAPSAATRSRGALPRSEEVPPRAPSALGRDKPSSHGDGDMLLGEEALVAGPAQADGAALRRDREERHEGIGGDRRRHLHAEDLRAVPGRCEALDDVARNDAAVGAGPEAGLHRMQDQRLDLDDLARFGGLGRIDEDVGHVTSSTQAARVTITSAEALQNSPELVSAMATIFCESASLMRVAITALPFCGPSRALKTCGCGFFSLKTWIALTWSAGVIGLSTDTVSGTTLPFSTSGGRSSFTLPSRIVPAPTTCLMAAAMVSGVACADANGSTLSRAAPARKARRSSGECMARTLLLQGREISHHILDLLGRQDGLALEGLGDAVQAGGPVIGRHDRVWIETRAVGDAQAQLTHRPARASAGEARRQRALQAFLGNRAAVAQEAKTDAAVGDDGPTTGRIARPGGERLGDGIALDDDDVARPLLRPRREGGQRQEDGEQACS